MLRMRLSKTLAKSGKPNINQRERKLRSQSASLSSTFDTSCDFRSKYQRQTVAVVQPQTISASTSEYTKRNENSLYSLNERSITQKMSLVPSSFFRNWWDDLDRYHREFDDHFKRLSTRDDFWFPSRIAPFNEYFRPWRNLFEPLDYPTTTDVVERNPDKYRVIIDVHQFAPEEITVKTDNRYITIEAKHLDRKDRHGYIARQFMRRYELPQGYDIGHVKPNLSSDGVLTITAPKLILPAPGERFVPIQRSRTLAINYL